MLCGAHESVAGGLSRAFERAALDGCRAVQIFTKNSNMWKEPQITDDARLAFRAARTGWSPSGRVVMAHTSYLINVATDKGDILERSIDALVGEVLRCSALGVDYAVLHPGAHLGAGDDAAIARVIESLDEVHERTRGASAAILLENTAGQGTCVGHRFEHLGAIVQGMAEKGRLGVCFDTQHAYAAGYDLSTADGYEATWEAFDAEVGLSSLRAFHLNDSKKPLGSRVDRHEHLGEGILGLPLFWRLVNDPRFGEIPAVLETEPREGEFPHREEVALLASLVGAKEPAAKAPTFALEIVEPKKKRK